MILGDAARGAVAGAVGTWLMDLVTTGLLEGQSAREEAAHPSGKGSVENLVDRLAATVGLSLDDRQRSVAAQAIHLGLGAGPGAAYAVLRRPLPLLGAGRGLLYGLLLWPSTTST